MVAVIVSAAAWTRADEVIFKNGDKLSGTITSADGGKLKIKSKIAGDVTVDLSDVQTFSTDQEVQIKMKDNTVVRKTVAKDEIAVDQIKRLNQKQTWTGSVVANGMLARGNTHTTQLGVAADATLRRDDEWHDDRFSLSGAYNFGKQRDAAGIDTTSADNWFAQAKYDKFFTEKFYGYGVIRYDHDRIAFLNYRLSLGVGVGYQWVEKPDFNLSTEAGVSYVYEDYSNDGNSDRVALRLAYHVDKKLNEDVKVFHNL